MIASAAAAGAATADQKAMPSLSLSPSPGTPVGLQIYGHVTISSAVNPTGTMTFTLYGPDDDSCSGAPTFTSTVPVNDYAVDSERYTTSHAGTYHWRASYSGDPANDPAGPTACSVGVVVAKATTVVRMVASAPVALGGAIRGTVELSGGFNPKGSMTFYLSGPNNLFCSGAFLATSTVPVSDNGTYQSAGYVPTQLGSYVWRAVYSGDADNLGAGPTNCLDDNGAVAAVPVARSDDINGDGRADVAMFRPSNGGWYVMGQGGYVFGQAGDVPVPGDYNGDGRTQVAVFRPSNGGWYIMGQGGFMFGQAGDVPVPGDYNGDGRTEVAVFRPSNGGWYIMGGGGSVYGTRGDVPVPADYDGDGRTDIAVFRPSTGTWYARPAAGGPDLVSTLGAAGDVPVAGDYDGDGRADRAVFRPSTGAWLLDKTTGTDLSTVFGTAGDLPATALPSVLDLLA